MLLICKIWTIKGSRLGTVKPEKLLELSKSLDLSLSDCPSLDSRAVLACKEQMAASIYSIVSESSRRNLSTHTHTYHQMFTLFDKIYRETSAQTHFMLESKAIRSGYKRDQIELFQELMSYISLRKLDLSSVFKHLRDKIWKLSTTPTLKSVSFFVAFDVLRQIWKATLSSLECNYFYSAVPYFICGDLYHSLSLDKEKDTQSIINRYRMLCTKRFYFEARSSRDSFGMPHFQGYNLFKCLLFLVHLLQLKSELYELSQEILKAALLTPTQKFEAYLILLCLVFNQEESENPEINDLRKLFFYESMQIMEDNFRRFCLIWKDFEDLNDQSSLGDTAYITKFVCIPLIIKMVNEDLFQKFYLESYILETHRSLKVMVGYFTSQELWAKLSFYLFAQLKSTDNIFFLYLKHYSETVQAVQNARPNVDITLEEVKSFQYLSKILLVFPLGPDYALQGLAKSKSAMNKKIYKIFRLIFYILTKATEASLSTKNVEGILTCQFSYLFYTEFEKPHHVLQSILNKLEQNPQQAEDLGTKTQFLQRVSGGIKLYTDLIASVPKYKILQYYIKRIPEDLKSRDWSVQFTTPRNINCILFDEFLEFCENSPNYRKNGSSSSLSKQHLDQLKHTTQMCDSTLSKFYQMFRLRYQK